MSSDLDLSLLTRGLAAVAAQLVPMGTPEAGDAAVDTGMESLQRALEASEGSRLRGLIHTLGLSAFEVRCVLACIGHELDPRFAAVVNNAAQHTPFEGLSVGLLVQAFTQGAAERADALRSLGAHGPLFRHRVLVHRAVWDNEGALHLSARVRVAEPVLRYLTWDDALGPALASIASLDRPQESLLDAIVPARDREMLVQLTRRWLAGAATISRRGGGGPARNNHPSWGLISGPHGSGKSLLVRALASSTGRPLLTVQGGALAACAHACEAMLDLLCHASLLRAMVCIEDAEQCLVSGANTTSALLRALDRYGEMVLFTTTRTEQLPEQVALRCLVHTRLARPDQDARQQIWEVHLPSEVDIHAEVDLRELASLFEFSGAEIRRAAQMAMELARQRQPSAPEVTASDLVAACRLQLEPPGEGLLERTPCTMRLQHIVLAPELRATAELIIAACENQARVLQQWGFGERISTGKGITVLLDGPPGTGKTLLAEIIANETGRPLTRVSLPDLMSKWMGETEKHIREVFRQARASHSVLLFDEADSLFSSRLAETRSANDRSANIEVNLLLQEIERYSGVCVLTTNHAAALDSALTRRIQFRMHFELPGERERAEIWATLAPSGAPFGADVDFCELGRAYELSGGHIKNALLRAAYEAARTSAEISQDLLRAACREECRSMGKVVFDSLPTVSRIAA